jgi:excisionase family DNA binding protein
MARPEITGQKSETLVYSVPEAGAKVGLGRNASYEAAARGEIPTVRFGKLLKVPKVAFDRMLESATTRKPEA